MKLKKATCGVALSAALAASLGVVGVALAADYEPTLLGNDSYTNQVDEINDYVVEGITYTSQIANQNADTVAEAEALSITIGSASDDASPILVTNSLGKTISEFSVRGSDESTYPSNMMSASLSDGESACWYFVYDYQEQTYTNHVGDTLYMPVNYYIQVTFDDGTTAEFHNINLNGVRTINLCWSDDYEVYYVERTTITNHTPDPTLYYEVNLAEEEDAEEFNFHVNSAGRLDALAYTESRGAAWSNLDHTPTQTIEDFGIEIPLYGTSQGDYTDGLYDELRWNSDSLPWRDYNND